MNTFLDYSTFNNTYHNRNAMIPLLIETTNMLFIDGVPYDKYSLTRLPLNYGSPKVAYNLPLGNSIAEQYAANSIFTNTRSFLRYVSTPNYGSLKMLSGTGSNGPFWWAEKSGKKPNPTANNGTKNSVLFADGVEWFLYPAFTGGPGSSPTIFSHDSNGNFLNNYSLVNNGSESSPVMVKIDESTVIVFYNDISGVYWMYDNAMNGTYGMSSAISMATWGWTAGEWTPRGTYYCIFSRDTFGNIFLKSTGHLSLYGSLINIIPTNVNGTLMIVYDSYTQSSTMTAGNVVNFGVQSLNICTITNNGVVTNLQSYITSPSIASIYHYDVTFNSTNTECYFLSPLTKTINKIIIDTVALTASLPTQYTINDNRYLLFSSNALINLNAIDFAPNCRTDYSNNINIMYLDYNSKKFIVLANSISDIDFRAQGTIPVLNNTNYSIILLRIDPGNVLTVVDKILQRSTNPTMAIFPVNKTNFVNIGPYSVESYCIDFVNEKFFLNETINDNIISVGVDDLERVWVSSSSVDNNACNVKLRTITPGLPIIINTSFSDSTLIYENTNLSSNVIINAFDYQGVRSALNLNVMLEGNAVFASNKAKSIYVLTDNTQDTVLPIIVTGEGNINVNTSIITQ